MCEGREKQPHRGEQQQQQQLGKRTSLKQLFLTGGLCPDASPQLPVQISFSDKCEYPRGTLVLHLLRPPERCLLGCS